MFSCRSGVVRCVARRRRAVMCGYQTTSLSLAATTRHHITPTDLAVLHFNCACHANKVTNSSTPVVGQLTSQSQTTSSARTRNRRRRRRYDRGDNLTITTNIDSTVQQASRTACREKSHSKRVVRPVVGFIQHLRSYIRRRHSGSRGYIE